MSHIALVCYLSKKREDNIHIPGTTEESHADMNRTNSKIAEQSKKKISEALLTIMKQYDFKEITITQISQEANLSRKTFYRLFSSKEDVLTFFFENLYGECLMQIKSRQVQHYWDIVQCYFDFCEERKSLLLLLKQHNLLTLLFEGSYKYAFQVFACIHTKEAADRFSLPLPYMLAYSIGGMYSMLLKWVEGDMNIPSSLLISELKKAFMSPDA